MDGNVGGWKDEGGVETWPVSACVILTDIGWVLMLAVPADAALLAASADDSSWE